MLTSPKLSLEVLDETTTISGIYYGVPYSYHPIIKPFEPLIYVIGIVLLLIALTTTVIGIAISKLKKEV